MPFWIPARFLLTGATALALAGTALVLRPDLLGGHYAAPATLALVHTLTLCFAVMTLLGAMHQLLPVVLVTNLHSPRLGNLTFGLVLFGSIGVVLGFASGFRIELLATGGLIALSGVLVFLANLLLTTRNAASHDAVSRAMLSSASYLALTMLLGILVALGRVHPLLGELFGNATLLHLGLGLFGTFFLAIAGAGHKLLAMFVLSHGVSQARLRYVTLLVHLGLALAATEAVAGVPLSPYAGVALAAAIILFILDLTVILRRRARRRLGLPLRLFVLAPLFLLTAAILALAGLGPAAVASLLVGFVTLSIGGMYTKILGFLTWQHRFAGLVGRQRVPLLAELPHAWLDRVHFWSLSLGVPLTIATQVASSPLLAASASAAFALAGWALLSQAAWIVFRRHALPASSLEQFAPQGG